MDADSGEQRKRLYIKASNVWAFVVGGEQSRMITDGTANIFSSANFDLTQPCQ